MNINDFKERIKLNGGVDRIIDDWEIIDIHSIPEIFNNSSEVDFYCCKNNKMYLLRIRKRKNKKLSVVKDKKSKRQPIYLVAEYNFEKLNNDVLQKILNEFSKILNIKTEIKTVRDLNFLFKDFLNIDFDKLDFSDIKKDIPKELKILFKIRQIYKKETGFDFFDKQDRLLCYENLDLSKDKFDFIQENQGAWVLQTENSELAKVYLDNKEELGLLKDFLVTYTLQELTFSLEHICYSTELSQIKSIFENVELIYSGKYVYLENTYNYYFVDKKALVLSIPEIELAFFSTNNEDLFNKLIG